MPFNLVPFQVSTGKARSVLIGFLLISFLSAGWADPVADRTERLGASATWMYQLGGFEDPAAVTKLAATDYLLLVIEPGNNHRPCTEDFNPADHGIPPDRADEACADVYPIDDIIAELRTTPSGQDRLLLAYIDIGQAEWYRDYWIEGWSPPTADGPGNPSFLLAADPDGWSGNFVVAYWDEAWRQLWLGKDEQSGLITELAELGFDGVYLDWVEAYDDDVVRATAQANGIDPAEAMVDFVADIRADGRAVTPDFLVIAQNAPFLPDEIQDAERYFAAIDALAVEDTWYFGNGETEDWNAGDGDVGPYDISDRLDCEVDLCMTAIVPPDNICPSPIETAACLETYPVSGDLHGGDRHACVPGTEGTSNCWSTASRLQIIDRYRARGLPILTVDYCIGEEKARGVYMESFRRGYRPLVTRVQLSRLTETPAGDHNRAMTTAWRVAELYIATLGYAPDNEGLQYWATNIDTDPNWTPTTVAQSFFDQPLVQEIYPADQAHAVLIEALYQNLFGRDADAEGLDYWQGELAFGNITRNQLVIALIEGGWANPEAAADMTRFGYQVEAGLAFAAAQAEQGIAYSQLSAADQEVLRQAGRDLLAGVTAEAATRDAAINSIPIVLGPLAN